ncbi:MAG: hypothetical protein ABIF09_00970 [Gemmatimonadota bacterium]
MIHLPPRPFFWATFRITVLAWLVLRVIVGMANGLPGILPPVSILLMLGVATIAVLDGTVARERLLLGNLCVGRRGIVAVSLLVSGALEVASALAVHVLGMGG